MLYRCLCIYVIFHLKCGYFYNYICIFKYLSVHLPKLRGQLSKNVGLFVFNAFLLPRYFDYDLLFHIHAELKFSRLISLQHENVSAK